MGDSAEVEQAQGPPESVPLIDRLAALPALADIPREQLQWLLDHGEIHQDPDGTVYRGDDLVGLFVLISGRLSVRAVQGGAGREVREITPGRATGYLPYSRMTTPRGYVVADGPVEFLFIALRHVREMTRECYEFTEACVQEMLARVRVFKADDKRQEKMAALGRLSAGLAHELNNPASAAARAARELDSARRELVASSLALGAAGLGAEALRTLEGLESKVDGAHDEPLSPIEFAELEDRILEWLEVRRLDAGLAYRLAERGLTVADLDAAASALDAEQLAPMLSYLAADHAVRSLLADVSSATERIHSLVAAVKKHTHMDRAPVAEPIHLEQHLADAVTLMEAKASLKGVSIELSVEPDLPTVEASVSELNQVWMHLLDNAVDAVEASGRVSIEARRERDRVVVRVVDDGPGIPPEEQERVFEPFFTTKQVGEGRGLGLDVVRAVVSAHRGTVELMSEPGRTQFCVSLPANR